MEVRIVDFPETKVAALEHHGPPEPTLYRKVSGNVQFVPEVSAERKALHWSFKF